MTAKPTPKPKPEITHVDITMADTATVTGVDAVKATWLEFIPHGLPGEFIGRDELLERLRQQGDEVSERTLRGWESAGVLPRPIRRWKPGGARSASRALYPTFAVQVVGLAKMWKDWGYTSDQIQAEVREHVPGMSGSYSRGYFEGVISHHFEGVVNDLVRRYEWPLGKAPAVVEIRVLGEDGSELHEMTLTVADKTFLDALEKGITDASRQ